MDPIVHLPAGDGPAGASPSEVPNATAMVNLWGGMETDMMYWTTIRVGTPPVEFRVQVDTGSSLLILPGAACAKGRCNGHVSDAGLYDPRNSITWSAVPCGSAQCKKQSCVQQDFCPTTDPHRLPPVLTCGSAQRCCAGGVALDDPTEPDATACGFYVKYGGGTDASGTLGVDTLELGADVRVRATFGLMARQSDPENWDSLTDGILGLAYMQLNCNPSCSTPVFDALACGEWVAPGGRGGADKSCAEDGAVKPYFALCFGEGSGVLALGGVHPLLYSGPIVFTPVRSVQGAHLYYTTALVDVRVSGRSIFGQPPSSSSQELRNAATGSDADAAPPSRDAPHVAIVDSGTTLLLLSRPNLVALVSYVRQHFANLTGVAGPQTVLEGGCCLPPGTRARDAWPTLTLELEGVALDLPPSLYFLPRTRETEPCSQAKCTPSRPCWCWGLATTPAAAGTGMNILGDTLMRGFLSVFDRANNRVGFAVANPAQCGRNFGGPPPAVRALPLVDRVEREWIVAALAAAAAAAACMVGLAGWSLSCARKRACEDCALCWWWRCCGCCGSDCCRSGLGCSVRAGRSSSSSSRWWRCGCCCPSSWGGGLGLGGGNDGSYDAGGGSGYYRRWPRTHSRSEAVSLAAEGQRRGGGSGSGGGGGGEGSAVSLSSSSSPPVQLGLQRAVLSRHRSSSSSGGNGGGGGGGGSRPAAGKASSSASSYSGPMRRSTSGEEKVPSVGGGGGSEDDGDDDDNSDRSGRRSRNATRAATRPQLSSLLVPVLGTGSLNESSLFVD